MARFRDATEDQQIPECIQVHRSSPGSLLNHARMHTFCSKTSYKESICDELCNEGVSGIGYMHTFCKICILAPPPLTMPIASRQSTAAGQDSQLPITSQQPPIICQHVERKGTSHQSAGQNKSGPVTIIMILLSLSFHSCCAIRP
jgi:hypothetical protein